MTTAATAAVNRQERELRYRQEGLWTDTPVHEAIHRNYTLRADHAAIVAGEVRHTYADLGIAVSSAAARLTHLGVSRGDRVAIALPNCFEHLVLTLASFELGASPVLIVPAFGARELTHIVQATTPTVLAVASGEHIEASKPLLGQTPLSALIAPGLSELAKGHHDLSFICAASDRGADLPDLWVPRDGETAVYLLSSGTTGLPKPIARSHQGYGYMIRAATEANAMTENTVNLVVMPAAHGFVMNCPGILGTLSAGGTVVLSSPESPAAALSIIEREGVTHSTLVPAVAMRWAHEAATTDRDLSTLEILLVGGARLQPSTATDLEKLLGAQVQQCYGMSEGLLCYTPLGEDASIAHNTQGRPLSPYDEVRIVHNDGTDAAEGVAGELVTRGPYTVNEYFNTPDATAAAFNADGFYCTGDLAKIDSEGNVTILGRVRDSINRGGEKIYADEVEEALLRYPKIVGAAVIAGPHPIHGQTPWSYVTTTEDQPSIDLFELRRFLVDQGLAPFKLPEHLVVVDALPLTAVGKVDKVLLRRWASQG